MDPRAVCVVFATALPLVAQETPAPPKRTLADGLVRQRIEIDRLSPPVVQAGLELGAGQGPMVLVVRRADGTLDVHEIQRGGEHGPAAEKPLVDVPVEQQVPADGVVPDVPILVATVLLARGADGALVIGSPTEARAVVAPTFDRAKVAAWLQRELARREGTRVQDRLHLRVAPDVRLQDVLTTWDVARSVGFTSLLLEDRPPAVVPPDDAALVAGLAARFDWPVEMLHGVQPVCDAELLFMIDGATPFGEVGGLLRACAKAGIWQLAFVGQQDAKTRWKLPTHLPFDRGR